MSLVVCCPVWLSWPSPQSLCACVIRRVECRISRTALVARRSVSEPFFACPIPPFIHSFILFHFPWLAIGCTCRLSCSVIVIVLSVCSLHSSQSVSQPACLLPWSIKCSLSIELGAAAAFGFRVLVLAFVRVASVSWGTEENESAAFQFHIITFLMTPPLWGDERERERVKEMEKERQQQQQQHSMMERINRKEQENSIAANTNTTGQRCDSTVCSKKLTGCSVHTVSTHTHSVS